MSTKIEKKLRLKMTKPFTSLFLFCIPNLA
jgi:hypothetical protein